MGMMSLVDADGVVHAIEDWPGDYSRDVSPLTVRPMRGGDMKALEDREAAGRRAPRKERYAYEDADGVVRRIEEWDGVSKLEFAGLTPRKARKGDAVVSRNLAVPDDVAESTERPTRASIPDETNLPQHQLKVVELDESARARISALEVAVQALMAGRSSDSTQPRTEAPLTAGKSALDELSPALRELVRTDEPLHAEISRLSASLRLEFDEVNNLTLTPGGAARVLDSGKTADQRHQELSELLIELAELGAQMERR